MEIWGHKIDKFTYQIIDDSEPVKAWINFESQFQKLRINAYGKNLHKFILYSELSRKTIVSIEEGEAYSFTSLWKYLYSLNVELIIDDYQHTATSMLELGDLMRKKRESEGLSMMDIFLINKLRNRRIIDIEKGRGYTRSTFLRYISVFKNIRFSIKQTY